MKQLFVFFFVFLVSLSAAAAAQDAPVVASGTVADEATKARIIGKLRELYGPDRVVDQIVIGQVVAPPNWSNHVYALLNNDLKSISRGSLSVDGTNVTVKGDVANEAQRQQVASQIATRLNPNYLVKNNLRVSAPQQSLIDQTLANRIIEFESGSATLTPAGQSILREIATAMTQLKDSKFEVIGHTDNRGLREANVQLSQARANAVKEFLAANGIDPTRIATGGVGPDIPAASNDSALGRQKNRRIEFRVIQ